MEKIIIKNFGPIKNAEIEIKKYNCFIGETSSGKSTAAKLITIFKHKRLHPINEPKYQDFLDLLSFYQIKYTIFDSAEILYMNDDYRIKVIKEELNYDIDEDSIIPLDKVSDGTVGEKEIADYSLSKKILTIKDFYNRFKDIFDKKDMIVSVKKANLNIEEKSIIEELEKTLEWGDQFVKEANEVINSYFTNYNPLYIPAERVLISMLSKSIFSIINSELNLPKFMTEFAAQFEKARNSFDKNTMNILNQEIRIDQDKILLLADKKEKIEVELDSLSTGLQSLIPLYMVFTYAIKHRNNSFVIEEPELNLFPTAQVELINDINRGISYDSSIIYTTHSPYVLSAIDNSILADRVVKKYQDNQEIIDKVYEILPQEYHISFDEVSSYYFSAKGKVKNIKSKKYQNIGARHIDEASNEVSEIYGELINLYYNGQV